VKFHLPFVVVGSAAVTDRTQPEYKTVVELELEKTCQKYNWVTLILTYMYNLFKRQFFYINYTTLAIPPTK